MTATTPSRRGPIRSARADTRRRWMHERAPRRWQQQPGLGGHPGNGSFASVTGLHPELGSSDKPLPDLPPPCGPGPAPPRPRTARSRAGPRPVTFGGELRDRAGLSCNRPGRCSLSDPLADAFGIRSEATPSPSLQRRSSRYTCRRDTPSSAAAASAASHPTTSSRSPRRGGRPSSTPPRARPAIHAQQPSPARHPPSNLTVVHRSMGQTDASADECGSTGCLLLLCTHPQTRWPTVQRTSDIDTGLTID